MPSLYDFIGAKPDASREDIARRLSETEVRLKQTGEIYNEKYERLLHQARHVLLDPEARREYDKKFGFAKAAAAKRKPPVLALKISPSLKSKIIRISLLALLIAVLAGVWTWRQWDTLKPWPVGSYLRSSATGQITAVLVERTDGYRFRNGKVGTAYRVKMLDSGELRWVGAGQLHAEFRLGAMAPPSERKVR
jgi:hypothetical protein